MYPLILRALLCQSGICGRAPRIGQYQGTDGHHAFVLRRIQTAHPLRNLKLYLQRPSSDRYVLPSRMARVRDNDPDLLQQIQYGKDEDR